MLSRTIAHIWGPLYINSFGCMIALGIIIFSLLLLRDPRRFYIVSKEQFINALMYGTLVGLGGCRLLYVLTDWQQMNSWYDMVSIWDGGGAVLGGIIAIVTIMPLYLHYHRIPVLPVLDLVALYSPLLQAIARLGCFFAGCCHGLPTDLPWSVTYTQLDSIAPLGIALHPSQLYSSLCLLSIFLLLKWHLQYLVKKPGQLLALSLALVSIERFCTDFFRADRQYVDGIPWGISLHQYIALAIAMASCILLFIIQYTQATAPSAHR